MDKVGFSDLRPEVEFGVLGRATLMEVRVRNSGVRNREILGLVASATELVPNTPPATGFG